MDREAPSARFTTHDRALARAHFRPPRPCRQPVSERRDRPAGQVRPRRGRHRTRRRRPSTRGIAASNPDLLRACRRLDHHHLAIRKPPCRLQAGTCARVLIDHDPILRAIGPHHPIRPTSSTRSDRASGDQPSTRSPTPFVTLGDEAPCLAALARAASSSATSLPLRVFKNGATASCGRLGHVDILATERSAPTRPSGTARGTTRDPGCRPWRRW